MSINGPNKIQLLPEHIIDQIKAGEVIERPSTLLKELLENSIDAGADEIEIEIQNNGLDLLSVKDNGAGIPYEELDLAFCRHATSKIESFEDIYGLFTYGFRGEALASIAAVSKLTCVSNQTGAPEGVIKINGGETLAMDREGPAEEKSGTAIYVRDLFYNTPARMKFIQSKTSEKNQLDKIIKAFLLTQPEVKFSLKRDGQNKEVYPARGKDGLKERAGDAIKKNRAPRLEEFRQVYDGAEFKAFISLESTKGNAGKSQFIFVNGRLVQDPAIHKIVLNSAQKLWPQGETGHYCAYIDLPSDRVDVNIHPNKIQVKFYEAGKIYSLVSGAIKEGITRMARTETLRSAEEETAPGFNFGNNFENNFEKKNPSGQSGEMEYRHYEFDNSSSSLSDYFERLDTGESAPSASPRENSPLFLAHFGESALMRAGDSVYAVKTAPLMTLWLKDLLESGDKTPVPLLVSQPLELKKPAGEKTARALADIGFELDRIGPGDYALRTFPNCLKHFPYREYLSFFLQNGGESFKDVLLPSQNGLDRHHLKAARRLGPARLVSEGAAVKITKEKLKKIL